MTVPYAHRPIHDADAHFMETPDWFHAFADPDVDFGAVAGFAWSPDGLQLVTFRGNVGHAGTGSNGNAGPLDANGFAVDIGHPAHVHLLWQRSGRAFQTY